MKARTLNIFILTTLFLCLYLKPTESELLDFMIIYVCPNPMMRKKRNNWCLQFITGLVIFLLVSAEVNSQGFADPTDWADMLHGAAVVHEAPARSGDVWGLLGKDGGYRLTAAYPYEFTIDLGELREIRSLYIRGASWGAWSPDQFRVEYRDASGRWQNWIHEENWAEEARSAYIATLENPIYTSLIRFHAERGGWSSKVTEERKKSIERARGNHILIDEFSVYPTTRIPTIIEPVREVAEFIYKKCAFIRENMMFLSVPQRHLFDRLERDYGIYAQRLREGSDIQYEYYDKLLVLNEEVRELERAAANVRNRQIAETSELGYVAGILSPTARPRSDYYTGPVWNSAQLFSAGHEYEDFQVAVFPVDREMREVTIELQNLYLEGGDAVIETENMTLYRGVFIQTQEPHYVVDYVGKWLDGLVPLEDGATVNIAGGQLQPFWITIYTPENQQPGVYRGKFRLRVDNAPDWEFEVVHQVWGFSLPREINLINLFPLTEVVWKNYYGKSWHDPDMPYGFNELGDFWLKRRLNPVGLYTSTPVSEYPLVHRFSEQGMNIFNIGRVQGGASRSREWFEQQFLEDLKAHDNYLSSQDLKKKAFIYLTDEPFPSAYHEVIHRGREIKKVTELPTYAALHHSIEVYPQEFKEVIDIWGPTFDVYTRNPEWFQQRRREGSQVWWYFVGWGFNMDRSPLRARVFTWLTWNENLEGVMQWAANRYWHKGQDIDNWDGRSYATYNGVANYVYPGPGGRPYPSIRLEHMRDGMEDYEYLYLLQSLVRYVESTSDSDQEFQRAARNALDMEGLITGITTFVDDPKLFQERRRIIGNLIEQKADLLPYL